jgi:prefoldin subunit 4
MLSINSKLFSNQIGEVFVHLSHADTMDRLAASKSSLQTEMSELEKRCVEHRNTLTDLKVHLYAKFGNNINLEAEDN